MTKEFNNSIREKLKSDLKSKFSFTKEGTDSLNYIINYVYNKNIQDFKITTRENIYYLVIETLDYKSFYEFVKCIYTGKIMDIQEYGFIPKFLMELR